MAYRVKVWDLSLRVFHWALVLAVLFLCWSGWRDQGMAYHPQVGLGVLGLLLYRVSWGFVGSRYARFGDFVRGPRALARALPQLLGAGPSPYLSHNPLGGLMVLLLLALLLLQALSGLGSTDDISIDGPLVALLSDAWVARFTAWHHSNVNVVVGVIAVHGAALVYHDLFRGHGLVKAMFSGCKTSAENLPSTTVPRLRLLLTAALSASICYLLFERLS